MLRYISDQFNDKHLSTVQAAFMKKKIKLGNNHVELSIWVRNSQPLEFVLSLFRFYINWFCFGN